MRIVDLSFPIKPHFRWKALPQRVATHAAGDPLQSTVMTISCRAFTHGDAPLHYLPDGRDIASMPLDQWIGDCAVMEDGSGSSSVARDTHIGRGLRTG